MLTLRQIRWDDQGEAYRTFYPDYAVFHDGQEIGRIYRSHVGRPGADWFWAINKLPVRQDIMPSSGLCASLEHAKAELKRNWEKW
ncbi:MAG: hypothetical protein ACJ8F3_21090 [Xanthobacteraceae bacterium]